MKSGDGGARRVNQLSSEHLRNTHLNVVALASLLRIIIFNVQCVCCMCMYSVHRCVYIYILNGKWPWTQFIYVRLSGTRATEKCFFPRFSFLFFLGSLNHWKLCLADFPNVRMHTYKMANTWTCNGNRSRYQMYSLIFGLARPGMNYYVRKCNFISFCRSPHIRIYIHIYTTYIHYNLQYTYSALARRRTLESK